jgi:outer membrane protein assembly factor BamB
MIVGDRLYLSTSNGVDWGHVNMPSPNAPAFIALDKKTGQLVGEESVGISKRTWHSNWSSPTLAKTGGVEQAIFGAGDGYLYGFAPTPVLDAEGTSILKELWRFDANPPDYRVKDGKPVKYPTFEGPSEVIATPVFAEGRIYAAIGQDPEHGSGKGNLSCIDPTGKTGDITRSGKVWSFAGIGRSISTVAVQDGLLFTADFDGNVYCLDAKTGKLQWQHDSRAHIWGSPLLADGKVYIGNEDGFLMVFEAGRKKKLIRSIDLHAPIYSTPVVADGVLYVASQTQLYAVGAAAKRAVPEKH